MSEIANSELKDKFTSEIRHFKRLPNTLGSVEVDFLLRFGLLQQTTYDIFLQLDKEKTPMAYSNVHKRVKRLEKLVLIKESERGLRKTIKYKLTSRGLFEILLLPGYYNGCIWQNNKKNIILQMLLYQFFEETTIKELSKIEYAYGRMIFSQYLRTCCERLFDSIDFRPIQLKLIHELKKHQSLDSIDSKRIVPDYPIYPAPFLLQNVEVQVKKLAHDIISLSSPQSPYTTFPVEIIRKDTKFTSLLRRMKEEFEEAYRNFNS